MWALFVACSSPTPPTGAPPEPPPPAAEPAPTWVLTGRASSEGLDTPTLAGGAAALGPACRAVNERLRGDGPPCFVEEWRAGDTVVRVERAGTKLRADGRDGRTTWSPLGGPLAGCLGDPLATPPAGDPGARRTLVDGRWALTLSGENRCGLGGTLLLDVHADRAKWSGLTVGGLPWDRGGRDAAREVIRAELRATVADDWHALGAEERADALRALAQDPHPDAAALLERRARPERVEGSGPKRPAPQ